MGSIERERDEALARQALGINTRGLLLHAAAGVADDDCWARTAGRLVRRIQMAGEFQAGAGERDVCSH
jgi:hypothetical protein